MIRNMLTTRRQVAGIIGAAVLAMTGCGGATSASSSAAVLATKTLDATEASLFPTSPPCQYLIAADFTAIGKSLHGQPISNHHIGVQVQDCYYDLGTENDLVYLDFFDTPEVGMQNYTAATDPGAGGGTPVTINGIGDSAYWLPAGNTIFVKKGSTVFQLKLNEAGKSDAQIQADATALATQVAARVT